MRKKIKPARKQEINDIIIAKLELFRETKEFGDRKELIKKAIGLTFLFDSPIEKFYSWNNYELQLFIIDMELDQVEKYADESGEFEDPNMKRLRKELLDLHEELREKINVGEFLKK